ncbi:MAG: hypothetical protein HY825_16925 [Acidobacteria bacterium]|nr:hypothetical protein [Acidobacteriota bacterium]
MRREWRLRVGIVLLLVAATCGRDSAPTGGPGASGSVTIGHDGGRVEFGALSLEVPAGALEEPTAITVRQLEDAPWGTIGPAFDFGPDGLTFAVPSRLTITFDELELPAGTDAESLAVRVLEDGRWVPLGGGEVDAGGGTVSALVSHFSVFGVAADPAAEGGAGTRWEANGVVAESSAEVAARLFVSTDIVTLLVDGQGVAATDLTVSGLPVDESFLIYVDTVEDGRVMTPVDGGVLHLPLDLDHPRFVWMQFHHSTTGIGGPNDMCENAGVDGVRVGNTCTLTHDLVGTVEIGDDEQVLDCAGYRIGSEPAAVGEGFGIRIVGWHGVEIRDCVVGGPGAGFSIGLGAEFSGWPADGSGLTVTDCTFEDNTTGVRLEQVRAASVTDSAVLRSWRGVEVASKSEAVVFERVQMEPPAVAAEKAVGFATEGFVGKENVYYIPQGCSFLDDSIAGVGTGVAFGMSREIEVRDCNLTDVRTGVLVRPGAMVGSDPTAPPEWSHRVWHNNVEATVVGISFPVGPLEVSWSSQGSFWNHPCPGTLFTPGVDSDRADVVDSHAYGAVSAWATGGAPGCGPDGDGWPSMPMTRTRTATP